MERWPSWDSLDFSWSPQQLQRLSSCSQTTFHGVSEFLLEGEKVFAQGHGVVLINTDEAGTLSVTNFRLLFVSEVSRDIIALGTIPLTTIEKFNKLVMKLPSSSLKSEKPSPHRLLQVFGKDMRTITFGFRPKTKQRSVVFDALSAYARPENWEDLYAFVCGPSKFKNLNPKLRLIKEYYRLLGKGSFHLHDDALENESIAISNRWWRITLVNSSYTVCTTYPFALLVPINASDEVVLQASSFRGRSRLPVITWCNNKTGAVLARSSQPLVGFGLMSQRSIVDEQLVSALCTDLKGSRRKFYIADARPRKNALANGAMGGGSESSSNYFQSEVVFFGIENIHTMRESLARLREYVDKHGTISSDGLPSFSRNGRWTWGGGNSGVSASVSTLSVSGWLSHVHSILAGSAWIATRISLESASVLVHCSDGWDRTAQLVSLASLLLDPFYRTFKGFQALVEKDWLAFGHPFSDRLGIPSVSGLNSMPTELSRQPYMGSQSPMRISSGPASGGSLQPHASNDCSPIFLQWVDCVAQLLRMYPSAFEFSSAFLVDFLDSVLSCRFGNFLFNSEKERQQYGVTDSCGCIWVYLSNLRLPGAGFHSHYNAFYDPQKYDGPLLPPAVALAPTMWPQFHLRWTCPVEAQAGEVDSYMRNKTREYTESLKLQEQGKLKIKESITRVDSLTDELKKERQLSASAVELARRAFKENVAINRALQSLGCKVHLSGTGINSFDSGMSLLDTKSLPHILKRNTGDREQPIDKIDISVSISTADDSLVSDSVVSPVCENMCPFSTREGCRWPNAGCAQLGSQFVGLKVNFEAFEQLSIYDYYFGSE